MLRNALALSCALCVPFSIRSIRAGRPNPGLAHQHLTAVRAAAMISGAAVKGAELGSTHLEFAPGTVKGGDHSLDVGTAGSISLVLQTLLPPLALTPSRTVLSVKGGTDVKWSPPIDYLDRVFLPALRRMGAHVNLTILQRGYYPKGGGEIRLEIEGSEALEPFRLLDRGRLEGFEVLVSCAGLPSHVPDRIAAGCRRLLSPHGRTAVHLEDWSARANGPGVSLCSLANFEGCVLGSAGVGERGLRSEDLAAQVCGSLLSEMERKATADICAADQLLLPMALAPPGSEVIARELSSHASTGIMVIEQFLGKRFEVEKEDGRVRVRRV